MRERQGWRGPRLQIHLLTLGCLALALLPGQFLPRHGRTRGLAVPSSRVVGIYLLRVSQCWFPAAGRACSGSAVDTGGILSVSVNSSGKVPGQRTLSALGW